MHLVLKLWVESYNFLKSFFFSTLLEWCLVLPSFSCISLYGLLEHCTLISWFFCLFNTFPMYGAVFFQYTFKLLIKKKFLESFSLATFCQYVNLLMKIAWDFQICYFITEDVLFTFHIFSCLILIFEQYAIKWLVNSIDYWMPMLGLFSTTETYIWCTCFTCFVG